MGSIKAMKRLTAVRILLPGVRAPGNMYSRTIRALTAEDAKGRGGRLKSWGKARLP